MSELREQAERAGQGLDVEALISARMEQVERAEKAEAERDRLANQLLNEVPDSYIQMKARALDAEAAIARVRDMCDTIVKNSHRFQDAWDEDPTAAQVPYGQAMVARHILQALDGE